MAIAPTPENFRAEMARHGLTRKELCESIGMHPNQWSQYVTGTRPLQGWAAHNIAYAINQAAGLKVLDVDMTQGLRTPPRAGKKRGWRKVPTIKALRDQSRARKGEPVTKVAGSAHARAAG